MANVFTWITKNNDVQYRNTYPIFEWNYVFGEGNIDKMKMWINGNMWYEIRFASNYDTGTYRMAFNTANTGTLAMTRIDNTDTSKNSTDINVNSASVPAFAIGTTYRIYFEALTQNDQLKETSLEVSNDWSAPGPSGP
jgi:hypothetical protein